MAIKKKKISELTLSDNLKGLYTIGVKLIDGVQTSVKVSLEYIQTAYENAVSAAQKALEAATKANNAAGSANSAASSANSAATKANTAAGNADKATAAAKTATTNANNAAAKANTAATNADNAREDLEEIKEAAVTATNSASSLISETETELSNLRELLSEVRTATKTAQDAYDLVSQIDGVNVFARIPATLVVQETVNAVVGSSPVLTKQIFPKTANQSVIFQIASGNGTINPDGVVSSPTEAGNLVINVISTISSFLWKQVTVKFRALQARKTENGTARTTENGEEIEC